MRDEPMYFHLSHPCTSRASITASEN